MAHERGKFMSGATDFWIRWRVRVGYVAGIAAFFFARPEVKSIYEGAAIAALGLLLRGYAAGHLRKHQQLATSGPYAYTRNPLYLGSLLLGAGFCVASHSWISTVVLAVYLIIFYPMVMQREARELTQLYGNSYAQYAARVPAFWPRLSPGTHSSEEFSWGIYIKNREYEAGIGLLVAMGILWGVMHFHK
jgi:protein-S-isoprenylcysteine O-methyltransferase Ste14